MRGNFKTICDSHTYIFCFCLFIEVVYLKLNKTSARREMMKITQKSNHCTTFVVPTDYNLYLVELISFENRDFLHHVPPTNRPSNFDLQVAQHESATYRISQTAIFFVAISPTPGWIFQSLLTTVSFFFISYYKKYSYNI